MKIYKLKPYFSEKLWGSTTFKDLGFEVDETKKIGEAWVISAHENGMSYFIDGPFQGQSLKDVFEKNRQLFGNFNGEYPLLAKIIAAEDYLSVQVHPDDNYAKTKHQSFGKPESWYVLQPPKDGQLIYGHHAKTLDELKAMVNEQEWDKLLKKVTVKAGDFLYVGAGKIHAITPKTIVYELQRSSDITYRVYDFDRKDASGNTRPLDLEDSFKVTSVPDTQDVIVHQQEGQLYSGTDFSLYFLDASKTPSLDLASLQETPSWFQFTIIEGTGTINGTSFKKFESAVGLETLENLTLTGDLKVLISWIKKERV